MLRAKIAEVLDARLHQMAAGVCKDYSAYKEEVGYIRGLEDAIKFAEDVEREPDERSDTA